MNKTKPTPTSASEPTKNRASLLNFFFLIVSYFLSSYILL